ncbi:LysM peptidoglycan-binding domain-containing protein [Lacticaseibacillus paracasei]|uniref:LysM peptidoglycan-binding domain-containing protein n=1 Tax=Lacticaseibacillus paracasei TaxID=1597 RepID=UPI0021C3F17C|nr:LysM peptidoglycan-binding domain-containing protein [Lacticaseibacillus paracasei]MCP9311157.1 peptidoglycan-binding protein LysM [Lacticaseibacillus paracasei]MCP9347961.1 peptidoglycan-binding protein LysM [Lacticaseibacillus paracasei]MCP9367548.1 peptidoglycan-binding protein LysM [Lacticaseibacillus paracasei]MCP9379933.1 peptidoglycan-binding protein LysM [Lacticaseibacillus paracasei]
MRAMRRQLWSVLTDKEHKVTLVHSKHHGWLAIGLTAFALGTAGISLATSGQVVHASDQPATSQQSQTNNGRVWTLRPVSQIEAQIKASNSTVYDIQWGDTLSTISEALNHTGFTTSVDRLAVINRIANVNLIYAGAKLSLQGSGDNATVTTQNADGTNQTFNLNPAKPAIATPAQQAEVKYTTIGGSGSGSGQQGITSGTGIDQIAKDNDAAIKAAAAAKAKAEAEKAAAEKAKVEAEAKLTALLNTENAQTLTDLQAKRTAAQAAVDAAKTKVDATQAKLPAAQTAVAQAQAAFDTANAAVNAKQAAVDQASAQVKTLSAQMTDLQNQLNTLTEQTKDNPDSQATITTVKAQLAVAQGKLTSYEGQLADATAALAEAKQAANQAVQNLNTANQALISVDNEAKAAQNDFAQAQTTLKALPTSVASQNSQAAQAVKAQLTDLNTKINQLDQKIKTLDTQIATWQDQLTTAQTNVEAAKVNITTAETQASKVDTTDHQQTLPAVQQTVADAEKTIPTIHVPQDTEKQVTINKDENGRVLTDLTGYKLLTAGTPVKTVETLANGDTITTYTTTNIYHKIAHQVVNKTVNVDEAGNILTSTDGYTKVSSSDKSVDTTDPKTGDITTTVTTTVVWKKTETPTHVTVNKTVNVDEAGNVLTSTDGYTQVSSSKKSVDTTDPTTGNITTTITTTVVWKKNETPAPTHTYDLKTVNEDKSGHVLTNTDGYSIVSSSKESVDATDPKTGNITTTVTTTVVWEKTPQRLIKNQTVNLDEAGKVLTNTNGYNQDSSSVKTTDVTDPATGDVTTTFTTTIIWKKDTTGVTITNKTVNVDENDKVLTSTDGYYFIGNTTVTNFGLDGNGNVVSKVVTTTNKYHKTQAKTVYKEVDVDEGGYTLTDKTGYVKVSSTPTSTTAIEGYGDTVTTVTTTNIWRNVEAAGTIIDAIKSVNDATTKLIEKQIQTNDQKVSIEQAEAYTDADLTLAVAKKFNVLVNGEQARTGRTQTVLTSDPKAYKMEAPRAVEVMYKFSHTRPVNPPATGSQNVTYQKGEVYMNRSTENISTSSLWKKDVDGSADKLSTLIANAMFQQYIVDERPENNHGVTGGHYENIINSGFKNIVIGVYVVDQGDYYAASTAVATGNDGTYNGN